MRYGLLSFLLILLLNFPSQASAHTAGVPFLKINDVFAPAYPITNFSVTDFVLPQDVGVDGYLINQPLRFIVDVATLPLSPELRSRLKFTWEFGDGTTAEGAENQHSYKKVGSYFLLIKADYGTGEQQLIESLLLNILPNREYQLPTATIRANGHGVTNPGDVNLVLPFTKTFHFDGTASKTPSAKAKNYFWDFGDGHSSTEAKPNYQYTDKEIAHSLLLRVTDASGFIADTQVDLQDSNFGKGPVAGGNSKLPAWTWVAGGLLLAGIGLTVVRRAPQR